MSDNIKSSTGVGSNDSLDTTDSAVTLMSAAGGAASDKATIVPPPVFEIGAVAYGICFIQMI